MASPSQGLGQKHAKRDDVSFLEGRVFRATGPSQEHWDRPQTRLAGSRSEAQPPGARMAVREKTVTRCASCVKSCATSCGGFDSATNLDMKENARPRRYLDTGGLPFKYSSYQARMRLRRSRRCFSSRKPWGSRGVDNHLGFNAVALQAAIEFLALAQRVGEVRVTLKNERRRFGVLKMDERGTVQEASDFLRFIRHAVEPAANGEPIGIGNAPGDEIVDAGHHVPEVGAAPIATIHFEEFFPVTAGAANVGIKDGVAACGEELAPRFDCVLPIVGRASMDHGDQRHSGFAA